MNRIQLQIFKYHTYLNRYIVKFFFVILIVLFSIACCPDGHGGPGGL